MTASNYTMRAISLSMLVCVGLGLAYSVLTAGGPESELDPPEEKPCEDCTGDLKLESRRTGIPEIDAKIRAENLRNIDKANRIRSEELQGEQRKRRDLWHGSKVSVPTYNSLNERLYLETKAANPDFTPPPKWTRDELADLERLADVFRTDLPAPPERLAACSKFLLPNAPDKCVGWKISLTGATRQEDGWIVTAIVQPKLLTPSGRGAFVSRLHTQEVWFIDHDGHATAKNVVGHNLEEPAKRLYRE